MVAQTTLHPDVLDLHPTYNKARYTLRGIYAGHTRGKAVAADWQAKGYDVYEFVDTAPDGTDLYFVSTRHAATARPRAAIPHQTDVRWNATRLFVATFRRVMRGARGKGYGTRWYKDLEEEKIYKLVGSLRLDGTVREAAGNILSSTIIAHPFPNGNHRSSVQLTILFLRSQGIDWPAYSLRGKGHVRLFRDCQPFFKTSKTLLLLLRRPGLVEVAKKHGYQWIQHSSTLMVEAGALDTRLSKTELKARHLKAALTLIDQLAGDSERAALRKPNTMKLREWTAKTMPKRT